MRLALLFAALASAPFSLRDDADRAGVHLGSAISYSHLSDPKLAALARRNVNTLTFENDAKWQYIHPERDRYDFTRADAIAAFAERNGMKMRGHVLAWHAQNPAWLKALSPTRAEAMALLRDHIFTVVGHFRTKFPGLITQWDVVNEGIDNDATRRQSVWQRWIGDDYVELAFRWAREAAGPGVKLFYNDYVDAGMVEGAEAVGGDFDDGDKVPSALPGASGSQSCDAVAKCKAIKALVTDLVRSGAPIDGVGFQAHEVGPDPPDYRALTSWVGKLGLEWAVTELDVPLPKGTENPGRTVRQAPAFRTTLQACLDDPACDTVVTWGLTDRYTWWRTLIPGGVIADALPFDDAYEAKPAAIAMHDALARAPARVIELKVSRASTARGRKLRVWLRGTGLDAVESVTWRLGSCRGSAGGRGAAFKATLRPCPAARGKRLPLRAVVTLAGGRQLVVERRTKIADTG